MSIKTRHSTAKKTLYLAKYQKKNWGVELKIFLKK